MLDGRDDEAGMPPMCVGIAAFVLRPAGAPFVKRCPAPPPTELKPACELLLLLLLPMSADDEASGAGRRAVPLNPGEDTTRA